MEQGKRIKTIYVPEKAPVTTEPKKEPAKQPA